MPRRVSKSYQFSIDAPELASQFQKDIIEALIPKAIRKQAQTQLALEALAQAYPTLSKMPQEEREKVYSQLIFPAYGVYEPPLFRRMFGAKPEPLLPLPKGAEEIPKELAGMKIRTRVGGRELKPGLFIPPTQPLTVAPSPLIQPEHEAELEKQAQTLFPDLPEERAEWVRTQKTALLTGIKPTREDILWETIGRAERMIDAYKKANPQATDKEAFGVLPPTIRRRYQEHIEKFEADKAYREAFTEDIKARKIEREEKVKAAQTKEKRLAEQQTWYQDFQERKLKFQDQWKKLATRGKSPQQVYRDALTAYNIYIKNLQSEERAHNQMEMGFAKLDPNYIPARFVQPRLSFEDWLRSEGLIFYERILALEGRGESREGEKREGELTPPGIPPKRERPPRSAFDEIIEKYLHSENFAIIENAPKWQELTLPEQNKIRRSWVVWRMSVSNRPRDPILRKQLETEAFASAPEFTRPLAPSWRERHPSLYALGATAVGTPVRLLETPQQLVASLVDPILRGKRYPATFGGVLQALREPFQRTGEWMVGEREETELPGREITRVLTDPLMYTPLGELAAARLAAKAAPVGVKMIPPLGRRAVARETKAILTRPGLAEQLGEIPRSWATWSPESRGIYSQIMKVGQRYIPKDQLQRVAETLVNAGPEQSAVGVKILQEGNLNKIRSLIGWAESPAWSRKALRGVKKVKEIVPPPTGKGPAEAAKSIAEEISQPGSYADYLAAMMEIPTL